MGAAANGPAYVARHVMAFALVNSDTTAACLIDGGYECFDEEQKNPRQLWNIKGPVAGRQSAAKVPATTRQNKRRSASFPPGVRALANLRADWSTGDGYPRVDIRRGRKGRGAARKKKNMGHEHISLLGQVVLPNWVMASGPLTNSRARAGGLSH